MIKLKFMKISIISPCYYNEANFPKTYEVIKEEVLDKVNDVEFELIFVDDGSKDHTLEKLKCVQIMDPRVTIVKLSKNFGEFRAIVAGMEQASGDAVVVISADLQDPPSLIPQMIDEYRKGEKVVLAVRARREESALKNWLADTYYKFVRKLVIKDYPKRGFDFFLIDKQVKDLLVNMQEKNSSIYIQIIWTGFKPKCIEYTRSDREEGKSMWSYKKRIDLFIDTFIVFSHTPIRIISLVGILMSLVGFIMAIYFTWDKVVNHMPYEGWTSIMVIILLVSGFQMIMLGVIGEYMWRNLDESRKRLLYIVDEVIKPQGEKHA